MSGVLNSRWTASSFLCMPPCHNSPNDNSSNFGVDSYETSFNMDRTLYPLTSALNQHSSNSGYQSELANVNVESIQETTPDNFQPLSVSLYQCPSSTPVKHRLQATDTFCPSDLQTYLHEKWAITLPSSSKRLCPFPFWTSPLSSSLIHCSLSPSTKPLLLPLETKSGALAKRFWSLLRCWQRSQSKNGWTTLHRQFQKPLGLYWRKPGLHSSQILFSVVLSSTVSPISFLLVPDYSTPSIGGTSMQLPRSLCLLDGIPPWRKWSTTKLISCFVPSTATDLSLSCLFALILSTSLSLTAKGRQW